MQDAKSSQGCQIQTLFTPNHPSFEVLQKYTVTMRLRGNRHYSYDQPEVACQKNLNADWVCQSRSEMTSFLFRSTETPFLAPQLLIHKWQKWAPRLSEDSLFVVFGRKLVHSTNLVRTYAYVRIKGWCHLCLMMIT